MKTFRGLVKVGPDPQGSSCNIGFPKKKLFVARCCQAKNSEFSLHLWDQLILLFPLKMKVKVSHI